MLLVSGSATGVGVWARVIADAIIVVLNLRRMPIARAIGVSVSGIIVARSSVQHGLLVVIVQFRTELLNAFNDLPEEAFDVYVGNCVG